MSAVQTPQFEVRRLDPSAVRRKRALLALLLLVVLAVGVAVGHEWARRTLPAGANQAPTIRLVSDTSAAQAQAQEIATLKQSEQVARVAAQDLRKTLAEREEEISALRADLAFYSHLVGSGEQGTGLAVNGVQLKPVPGSRAWDATITLTQNARRGEESKGAVELAVEGVRDGKLDLIEWKQIAAPDSADGLPYAFKYFQQLHATVMLPEGFTPNRLRVLVDPNGSKRFTYTMAWSDALKSQEENNVQR